MTGRILLKQGPSLSSPLSRKQQPNGVWRGAIQTALIMLWEVYISADDESPAHRAGGGGWRLLWWLFKEPLLKVINSFLTGVKPIRSTLCSPRHTWACLGGVSGGNVMDGTPRWGKKGISDLDSAEPWLPRGLEPWNELRGGTRNKMASTDASLTWDVPVGAVNIIDKI